MGECGLCWSAFSSFDDIADSQGLNGLEEEIGDAVVGNVTDHGPKPCTL